MGKLLRISLRHKSGPLEGLIWYKALADKSVLRLGVSATCCRNPQGPVQIIVTCRSFSNSRWMTS